MNKYNVGYDKFQALNREEVIAHIHNHQVKLNGGDKAYKVCPEYTSTPEASMNLFDNYFSDIKDPQQVIGFSDKRLISLMKHLKICH